MDKYKTTADCSERAIRALVLICKYDLVDYNRRNWKGQVLPILQMRARGMTLKQIGTKLGRSRETIRQKESVGVNVARWQSKNISEYDRQWIEEVLYG